MARVTTSKVMNTKQISGVYEIRNISNGKRYIGSTINIILRFKQHLNRLKENKHLNRYLQFAWNKYGENAFKFDVLLYCAPNDLLFYEQRALDFYNSLYNLSPTAGSSLGCRLSEETKRKMATPLSEEHKKKISKSMIGKNKGKKQTPGQIYINSESHKGKTPWNKGRIGIYSEETKYKMGKFNKGRPSQKKGISLSANTRKKISETSKGKIVSEETREKLSIAAKKQWALFKKNKNEYIGGENAGFCNRGKTNSGHSINRFRSKCIHQCCKSDYN